MSGAAAPGAGWLPVAAHWQDGGFAVDWCHFGATPLAEPFFGDSVARRLALPFNQLFRPQTPIAALGDWAARAPGLAPSGFVFHTSRCGSTLLAQLLAALPRSVVLSEAPPLDAVLRAGGPEAPDEEERILWLRWMMSALGQKRRGDEQHLFVKFDCWHALDLPLIRRAFPGVPCLFLYREPVALLASHLRRRGAYTVPGLMPPALFGIDPAAAPLMPPAEYCARVLASILGAALRHADEADLLLVHYRDLPDALWGPIAAHFGIDCDDADRAALADVARHDAYAPGTVFVPRTGRDAEPPEAAYAAAATWLDPLYRQLEARRLAG